MASNFQLNEAVRNAMLDAFESVPGNSCALEIRTGAQPANCAAASSGTILATILLPADWMNAAATGQKTKAGTWQDAAADNPGTAAHFRIYGSQVTKDGTTCFCQGTAGVAGSTPDMVLDSVDFTAGQQFTITTFTLTAPSA